MKLFFVFFFSINIGSPAPQQVKDVEQDGVKSSVPSATECLVKVFKLAGFIGSN